MRRARRDRPQDSQARPEPPVLAEVAKQIAHQDETRRYRDTGLNAVGLTYIGPARCLDQGERRANCALRLVFVCLRVAEIGENPVIQQLGDGAACFRDDCRTALMKGGQQPMQDFRIALLRTGKLGPTWRTA